MTSPNLLLMTALAVIASPPIKLVTVKFQIFSPVVSFKQLKEPPLLPMKILPPYETGEAAINLSAAALPRVESFTAVEFQSRSNRVAPSPLHDVSGRAIVIERVLERVKQRRELMQLEEVEQNEPELPSKPTTSR